MKYGMRERISGIIIVVALGVIFVPMLFDEPESPEQRPDPVLTIDPPVDVERRDVPDPTPPEGLGQIQAPVAPGEGNASQADQGQSEPSESSQPQQVDPEPAQQVAEQASSERQAEPEPAPEASQPREDPIAALARQAEQRTTSGPTAVEGGEWAVQVGSFGEAGNAQRLMQKLRDQGYPAYSRERNNSLTTVYVGPFGASEDAEGVMSELKSRENLQGLLVKVDS